jgi:hypothetical protein
MAKADHLPRASALGPRTVRAAQLDHSPALVQIRRRGGEVDADRGAPGTVTGDRGRQRGRDVDHHQIAGDEDLRETVKALVGNRALAPVGHQQRDLVASHTPGLGRAGGLQSLG